MKTERTFLKRTLLPAILFVGFFSSAQASVNIDDRPLPSTALQTDTLIKIKDGSTGGKNKTTKISILIEKDNENDTSRKVRRRNGRRTDRNQRIFNDYDAWYEDNAKTAHFSGFGIAFIGMNASSGSSKDAEDFSSSVKMSSSLKYDLSFFDHKYSLGRNNLSFVTGLGIEFNSVHFVSNVFLNYVDNKAVIETVPDGYLNNARFHSTYLTAPFLIELNSGRYTGDFPFFINAGVLLKLKTMSSSKVWNSSKNPAGSGKLLISKEIGLKPITMDFIIQAGKGNWGIFATYSPISPFQKDLGPELNTYSIGLKMYFSQR